MASCVMLSAYNILRCELADAERSIEAGLRMTACQRQISSRSSDGRWDDSDYTRLLTAMHFRYGYVIWAPDVSFQFERSRTAEEVLSIESDCVKGPFSNWDEAIMSYRSLVTEVVTKMLRNLVIGAYVVPSCALALEVSHQLEQFTSYWKNYCAQLPLTDTVETLDMLQLRIGYFNIYLLYHTRVICPNELEADEDVAYMKIRHEILDVSEKIIAARHAGHTIQYIDGFVNRIFWGLGMYSFGEEMRRRVSKVLRSQTRFEDGLVNWLRSAIIGMIADANKVRPDSDYDNDEGTSGYIVILDFLFREHDQMVVMRYTTKAADERAKAREQHCKLDFNIFDVAPTRREIGAGLQTILAGYRMFGKPSLKQCPQGYIRPMHFRGKLVPVCPGVYPRMVFTR